MRAAGLDTSPEQIAQGVQGGEEATKRDGRFFWRGGGEIKQQYISQDMIAELEERMIKSVGLEPLINDLVSSARCFFNDSYSLFLRV